EVAAVHRPFDRALDALLEVRDQVANVTAEDLVAALAAEHDLAVARRELRDDELRERAGARDRVVEVVDHVADPLDEVVRPDLDFVQLEATIVGDAPGV